MMNPLAADLDHILAHTRDLWEELRNQRIFMTGGTGFFGCWLLESFLWANEKLDLNTSALVLTRNLDAFRKKAPHLTSHPAIRFQIGDVRSFEFPKGQFSHIVHAATESSSRLDEENPLGMLDVIVQGSKHTLEFARQCGAKKFLLISSGAVYGKPPLNMIHIPEEYCGAPNPVDLLSAYGEGKRFAELLCTLYAKKYGFETKIARCFAFVGPYLPLDVHFAIGNFIRDALHGGPIHVKGDGTPYRSYLYAADLAIWLWTILFKGRSCRPYNVGSEDAISILGLADAVAQAITPMPELYVAKQAALGKTPERYVPSIKRPTIELGLKQIISLSEGIQRTLEWHSDKFVSLKSKP